MISSDEPGLSLKWRTRNDGTRVAYWVCKGSKIYANFKPRTVRLWSGKEPTDADMQMIREQCRKMQQEIEEFAINPRRSRRPYRVTARIYFIKSRNMVKIGYTAGDPQNRLRKMQIGSGEKLTLLGTIEGDQVAERQLHWRFKKQHSHGEWFFLQGAVKTYVNKLFAEELADEQAQNKA